MGATPTQSYHVRSCPISIHAPHEGERPAYREQFIGLKIFQSTLPARGSDRRDRDDKKLFGDFNPRSPQGGATYYRHLIAVLNHNFNPRSPRGGATPLRCAYDCGRLISIHAPHEGERRSATIRTICPMRYFNPHSPRGGATKSCRAYGGQAADFNPRSPRGGATSTSGVSGSNVSGFQSTLPTRGSDAAAAAAAAGIYNFNPRSPRGGATSSFCYYHRLRHAFQSTLPTRGSDHARYGH